MGLWMGVKVQMGTYKRDFSFFGWKVWIWWIAQENPEFVQQAQHFLTELVASVFPIYVNWHSNLDHGQGSPGSKFDLQSSFEAMKLVPQS